VPGRQARALPAAGQDFTAKEFRTWGGSVRAFRILRDLGLPETEKAAKKLLSATFKQVAAHLGNTPTVCRTYYVHRVVIQAWRDGRLFTVEVPPEPHGGLGRSEHGLLRLLTEAAHEQAA
jgi:DNA topoisomerase IB